jgi:hypothetical protein
MTEDEWNACDDATAMMRSLRGRIGDRKLRLLACACARTRWSRIDHEEYRSAVVLAERHADGLATRGELLEQENDLSFLGWGPPRGDAVANQLAEATVADFAFSAAEQALACMKDEGPALIRELIDHPPCDTSRVPRADGRWDVLAHAIYNGHRFRELPRLAELLEKAGGRDARLLAHLRSPGPHFRGCWALDTVLGNGQGKAIVTDEEWRAETHPFYMLRFWTYLRDEPSPRKLRLLACACCRRVPHLLAEPPLRRALEVAEAFADGRAGVDDLVNAGKEASALARSRGQTLAQMRRDNPNWPPLHAASQAASAADALCSPSHRFLGNAMHATADDGGRGRDTEDAEQARLVREILGSPLRSITIGPSWLRPEIAMLARRIYDERAFERCHALAAMLEGAGCGEDALLSHLREEPSAHVRGCWALDALHGWA